MFAQLNNQLNYGLVVIVKLRGECVCIYYILFIDCIIAQPLIVDIALDLPLVKDSQC